MLKLGRQYEFIENLVENNINIQITDVKAKQTI